MCNKKYCYILFWVHGKRRLRLLKIHHNPLKSVNEEKYQRTISHNICKICGIKFPLESMLLRHTFNQITVSKLKKLFHLKTLGRDRKLIQKITRVKYNRRYANARENESSFSLAHDDTKLNMQNNSIIEEDKNSHEFEISEKSKMILRTRNHQKNYKTKLHEFSSSKNPTIITNSIIKANEAKTTEELYKCDLCDYMCSKKNTLYAHRRKHGRGIKREVFSCNECNFKSKKQSSLYSHIWKKHESIQVPAAYAEMHSCNACDYKNKSKYALKVHIARKHTDDYKYVCETCGKKYKVKGDLTNHIRFNHREEPVICDVCGKTCLNSNSLYVHQKFAHYKAQFECQVCKRRMVSQENLDEHMQRQHEKRDNVVCKECGKTFSRHSRLKVHMRIHTGDKPYTCTVCSKSFARRPALKQHLLTHTGVRPYVCVVCGKAFTQKPGLISHRKSHPGPHPPLPRVLIDHILNNVMNT